MTIVVFLLTSVRYHITHISYHRGCRDSASVTGKQIHTKQVRVTEDCEKLTSREQLPYNDVMFEDSASCGVSNRDIVIGVLASPTPRSTKARQVIRDTWMRFPTNGKSVIVRFLLGVENTTGQPPAALKMEAKLHKDIVFLDAVEAYSNLVQKVHMFFRWAAVNCPGITHVFKTDDDSFVRLDLLGTMIDALPSERLYFGSFLRNMPARKKDKKTNKYTHQPLAGNEQNFAEWPVYASGAGYIVSFDVVILLGFPVLPRWHQTAEDRAVGVALFGYNITYISSNRFFRPWGTCDSKAVMLHYQRDTGLMQRRFERATRGADICGEGWAHNVNCTMVDQGKTGTLRCPQKNMTISRVIYADVGQHKLSMGYDGPCSEGPSALAPESECVYKGTPTMVSVIAEICLGKHECYFKNDLKRLKVTDPCPGRFKRILTAVECV